MKSSLHRRHVLAGLSSIAAGGPIGLVRAQGRPMLTAVEWGGRTLESIKSIQKFQNVADVRWELHAGGAAAILAKIRAAKPAVNYDVVAAWSPVFVTIIREDWAEPVTVDEMPNLADIPAALFIRDEAGAIKSIPRDINPHLWGYRSDLTPFPLTRIEDLLDPRLRGKIVFPAPVLNTGTQMISIAVALGGSEKQLEPAWDFVKQLARSGNIGRIASSDTEIDNSLTSGETSICFGAASRLTRVADEGMPIVPLAKMPPESGFKTIIAMQGWAILKGGNTKLAKAWVNALISPEANALHAETVGSVPANSKAKVPPRIAAIRFSEEELAKYAYTPDWNTVSQELPSWVQRWEREVNPLL